MPKEKKKKRNGAGPTRPVQASFLSSPPLLSFSVVVNRGDGDGWMDGSGWLYFFLAGAAAAGAELLLWLMIEVGMGVGERVR